MPRLSAVDPGANNILLHEPFIYFIRPSVNGHLGCFHGLTTASGAGDLRPEKEAAWVVPCLPGLLAQPETGVGALRWPPPRARRAPCAALRHALAVSDSSGRGVTTCRRGEPRCGRVTVSRVSPVPSLEQRARWAAAE